LSALFLGSLTEYVLGNLHRPVLLVGPHASSADLAEPALLVSVGETDRTGVTVPVVRSWVETFATSPVWAVHVREGPIAPPQVQTEQRAADNVHHLTSELHRHGLPAQHKTILGGAPTNGLEQFATQTAGAVLLAVSARWTEPHHRHRHSVARALARRSTRPVLVVPANDVEETSGGTAERAGTSASAI
jgi:nucleotide-binding universal stress UspA family protein